MIESKPVEIFPAFQEYLQPARFKIAYGGRGSAKTRTFITLLLDNALYFGWRIVCFREIMKSLDDSIYQEIIDEIHRRDLSAHFDILRSEIRCLSSTGVFKFDGLHRNQQKIKGYAGFDCAFVEEAANVTADSWKMLIPTLRKSGSEVWCCFNPESPLDDTYKRFVTQRIYPDYNHGKRYCISKKINYTDNPRFPPELQDDMELMKENDYDLYLHVYEGEPVANSDLAIIPPAWVAAAVDLHEKLDIDFDGLKRVGFDVADEGVDANAIVSVNGFVAMGAEEWKDKDPNSAANHCFNHAIEFGAKEIIFDCIGVGAGAKGELRNRVDDIVDSSRIPPDITAFNAADSVNFPDDIYDASGDRTHKQMFLNLKAQSWWLVRDKFYNAYKATQGKPYDADNLISISSQMNSKALEKLKAELSIPRREYANGKLRVEPKDKMKKRGVNSPNLADAFIMAFAPESEGGFFVM
jgi:phage terminase large subunit